MSTDNFINLFLIYSLIITGGNLSSAIEFTATGFMTGAVILGMLVLAGYLARRFKLGKYI